VRYPLGTYRPKYPRTSVRRGPLGSVWATISPSS
jgi:hypothetical protein